MIRYEYVIVIVCSLIILPHNSQSSIFKSNKNWVSELRSTLLKDYDAGSRPVKDHLTNTSITIGVSLNSVHLDEHAQQMTAATFISFKWKDQFLKWNSEEFGEVDRLHLDREELWMPDIALFNSVSSEKASPTSTLPVLVFQDGLIIWVPPFSAVVPCQMNMAHWPSDLQTCSMRFGSWAHHSEHIDLQLKGEDPVSVDYFTSRKWKLVNHTAQKGVFEYGEENYPYVDFKFTFKRNGASQAIYITRTTFAVMFMVLGSYLLPLRHNVSRLLLHLFSLVIVSACNFVMFLSLPETGGNVPHIVKYFSGTIILTTLSLLCNILMSTIMTTNVTLRPSINGRWISVLKSETRDLNGGEFPFSALNEESSESPLHTSIDEETLPTKSGQGRGKKVLSSRTIFRLINGVLFTLFTLAYVVDYSVMTNAVDE